MNELKKWMYRAEFSSILILVIMFILTAVLQKNFFEGQSIVRNINAFVPLIILSMGQAVVLISGGLDLSAGSSLSLLTCIMTSIMVKDSPLTGVTAIIVAFAAAVLIGIVNGIGIGYLRLPPVVITFATSYMWLGIALFLMPTPGGQSVNWFKVFYDFGSVEGMPAAFVSFGQRVPPALLLLLIGCLGWYILSKTRTVRYIYAVGSSIDSAYDSGVNTAKTQLIACVINAMFIFLAALYFVGQNQSGDARMGDPMTLRAIASAVVGGIALSGGKGNVYFAIVGALILSFVNKIIFFANIPNAWQTFINGTIVIVAITAALGYTIYAKRAKFRKDAEGASL